MNCRDLTDLVTDYLESRLSRWERLRLELHLVLCPPCRVYLDQMRALLHALGRLPDPLPLPAEVRDALLSHFRRWKHGRRPGGSPQPPDRLQ